MQLEMFALRHYLAVLQRRARTRPAPRNSEPIVLGPALTNVAAMSFSITHR